MELIKRKLSEYRCRVSLKVLNRGLITPIITNKMSNARLPMPSRSVYKPLPKQKEKKRKKKKRKGKRKK